MTEPPLDAPMDDKTLVRIRGSAHVSHLWHLTWPLAYVDINTAMVRTSAVPAIETAYKADGGRVEFLRPGRLSGASIRVIDGEGETGNIRFYPTDDRLFSTLAANGWELVERVVDHDEADHAD